MTQRESTGAGANRPSDGSMVRPQEGRVVAGVALAVANRLGMSPGAVRVVWFILGFFGGLGLLLYIAGWLLIPEEGATRSIAEDVTGRLGDATTWLGMALIIIAGVALITALGWVRTDLAWAVALLAVGVLMYRGHLGTVAGTAGDELEEPLAAAVESEPDGDAEPAEAAESPAAAEIVAAEPEPPAAGDEAPAETVEPRPTPRPRREKSILGRLTLGTVFIAMGFMAVLDTSGAIRPAFSHYLAVAVGIIGVGLIVGSVYGRSRGLIFAGIVLVPIMLASSVVTATFRGGWGDPVFRPASIAEVSSRYNLTGGDMEIDLRRLDLSGEVVEIEGDVGFGRLLVILPDGAGFDLKGHVGFGDLIVFGDHNGGIDVERSIRLDGDGRVELDLDVGFGALEVTGTGVGIGFPGGGIRVGDGGVDIDFPGGGIQVGDGGVDIDIPGGGIKVGDTGVDIDVGGTGEEGQ